VNPPDPLHPGQDRYRGKNGSPATERGLREHRDKDRQLIIFTHYFASPGVLNISETWQTTHTVIFFRKIGRSNGDFFSKDR
jgi:hypothetical protein